jgi:hypothetical protein
MAVHLAGYMDKIAAEEAEDLVKGNEAADAALVKEIAAANKKAEEEAKQVPSPSFPFPSPLLPPAHPTSSGGCSKFSTLISTCMKFDSTLKF